MNDDDVYMRAMYGQYARHVPVWLWVQDQGNGTVIVAGASRGNGAVAHPLRYGSDHTHQVILGELIVRPHVVLGTNAYRGQGVSGLLRSGLDLDELVQVADVVADPMGKVPV